MTHLYRHFDSDGNLLYVGVSCDVAKRLGQHLRYSKWRLLIKTITVERFPTRQAALRAETKARKGENPIYNDLIPDGSTWPRTCPHCFVEWITDNRYLKLCPECRKIPSHERGGQQGYWTKARIRHPELEAVTRECVGNGASGPCNALPPS